MAASARSDADLLSWYKSYIAAINELPDTSLNQYLTEDKPIVHNDRSLTREQYHALIIPGSIFTINHIGVVKATRNLQAELSIEMTDGRKVNENVEYWLDDAGKIAKVRSELEWIVGGPDEE